MEGSFNSDELNRFLVTTCSDRSGGGEGRQCPLLVAVLTYYKTGLGSALIIGLHKVGGG